MLSASQNKNKSLWIFGDVYTTKNSGDVTHGIYCVWEIEVGPNNGPPLHKHSKEDEAFYVLEGEFSFPYGNEEAKVAGKGQFINAPRGRFHTYKNIEIGISIDDKSSFHPPQITPFMIENVVKTAARYGLEIKT